MKPTDHHPPSGEPREERFRLPVARQFVTTWWIPDQYAGQTTATLHRLAAAVPRTGVPVTLLTFSALHDNQRKIAQLRERGALPDGVTVRNLFEDVRAWDRDGTLPDRLAARPPVDPDTATDAADPIASTEQGEFALREYSASGELVFSTMFRADGSPLCRDYPVRVGEEKKRFQRFFGPDGTPGALLGSTWELYYLWLDTLIGDEPAVIVNESKSTARFMSRYDNPQARVIHLFHESHLADSDDPFKGPLSVAHRRIVPHLDRFDLTVFLTAQQLSDVAGRFGGGAGMASVPNAGPTVQAHRDSWLVDPRRGDRGIAVATLKPLKRLDHAIDAVARARAASRRPLRLDLYGRDAGALAGLEQTVTDTDSGAFVRFAGYTPNAAEKFAHASFSLMTSTTEGQSLVLLESMAAGCVPIAYDIRYGPDELIVAGETGFLVPAGDVAALSEQIAAFVAFPKRRMRQLRQQARERLAAFSDDEIQARWAEVQRRAVQQPRVRIDTLSVSRCAVTTAGEISAQVTMDLAGADIDQAGPAGPVPLQAWLLLTGRQTGRPQRLPLRIEAHTGRLAQADLTLAGRLDPADVQPGEAVSDVHLEVVAGASARHVRLRDLPETPLGEATLFTTGYGNVSLRT